MTKKQQAEAAKQQSIETLKTYLKPGDTVYVVVKHVSKSGMTREIGVYTIVDGELLNLTHHVARALGWSVGKHDGVKVSGCGMDMGFHLVYTLSRVLFKGEANGKDPGYMLNRCWM
jgi:hypothetical protein